MNRRPVIIVAYVLFAIVVITVPVVVFILALPEQASSATTTATQGTTGATTTATTTTTTTAITTTTTAITTTTTATTVANPDGLLIVGGLSEVAPELWSLEDSCLLRQFGGEGKIFSTLDTVEETVISCLAETCEKFEGGSWVPLANTVKRRTEHTSAVFNSQILLFGGSADPSSTEWIPLDGSQPYNGFAISPGRKNHCSIQPSSNIVILTGGSDTAGQTVTEVTIPDGTPRNLPGLISSRQYHACGSYQHQGTEVLMNLYLK